LRSASAPTSGGLGSTAAVAVDLVTMIDRRAVALGGCGLGRLRPWAAVALGGCGLGRLWPWAAVALGGCGLERLYCRYSVALTVAYIYSRRVTIAD
jgi:hypothetical protein